MGYSVMVGYVGSLLESRLRNLPRAQKEKVLRDFQAETAFASESELKTILARWVDYAQDLPDTPL